MVATVTDSKSLTDVKIVISGFGRSSSGSGLGVSNARDPVSSLSGAVGETRLEGDIAGCPAELKRVMGKGERVRAGGILDKEEEGQGSMQQG